jgi:hypothetical protein
VPLEAVKEKGFPWEVVPLQLPSYAPWTSTAAEENALKGAAVNSSTNNTASREKLSFLAGELKLIGHQ